MFTKIAKWAGILCISLAVAAYISDKLLNYSIKDDKNNSSEFIKIKAQYIVNMEIEKLIPLLEPKYLIEFNSNENKRSISKYLLLGKVKSYEDPIYYGSDTTVGKYSENQRKLYFLIVAHFNTGNAEIKVSLLKSDSSFLIEKISITGI